MKRLKMTAKLSLIWISILAIISLIYVFIYVPKSQYTYESDSLWVGDTLYAYDNASGFGILYEIAPNGDVKSFYSTKNEKYISGWEILSLSLPHEGDAGNVILYAACGRLMGTGEYEYRIIRFSTGLKPDAISPAYTLSDEGWLNKISVSAEGIRIAAISPARDIVSGYLVPISELYSLSETGKSAGELSKGVFSLNPDDKLSAANKSHFAEAVYDENGFSTRYDSQAPVGIFAEDEEARVAFDNRNRTFAQCYMASGLSLPVFFILCLAGVGAIVFVFFIMPVKRRIFYRILWYELFLFVALLSSYLALGYGQKREYEKEYIEAAGIAASMIHQNSMDFSAVPDLYGTNAYSRLLDRMRTFASFSNSNIRIKELCYVKSATGEIVASVNGAARKNIRFVFGEDERRLPYSLFSASLPESPDYQIVCAIDFETSLLIFVITQYKWLLASVIIIFIVLSIAGCYILVMESRDMHNLGMALEKLADGKYSFKKPDSIWGWDLEWMWNSAYEIRRAIKSINYLQFKVYKAYYRFAPKNIERILKKDSISDVKSGDAIQLFGTQVLIRTERQRNDNHDEMIRRNEFMRIVEKQLKAEDGIFISSDLDLSKTRILFLEDVPGSIRFGVNFLQELRSSGLDKFILSTTVLVHRAPFAYGIAGTDEQASAFLSSPETERLEDYLDWFHTLNLELVATENVVSAEEGLGDLRHIGFVCPANDDTRIEIYEVLDALDTKLHTAKLRTAKAFKEALELYYTQDFYLARNTFTEILREVPQDEVAKWYLFDCERMLNETVEEEFTGALHK